MKLIKSENVTFEDSYKIYPRKEGKTLGMKKLKKEHVEPERFHQAVKNYAKLCELESRDRKYIKLFSTFANCWEDYESAEDLGLHETSTKIRIVNPGDL